MKTIGVIGSGSAGKALATGFKKHGYEVMIGSREPAKLDNWINSDGNGIKAGDFSETAAFGEIVVLVVRGDIALEALQLIGEKNLNGKTIIDVTNPIDKNKPPVNGVLPYFTDFNESLMEKLQNAFPDARFVKSFNSIGGHLMVNPSFKDGKPTMFICGNNDDAKAEVTVILDQFGFETEDCGKVEAARAIEPLCMLWCIPGFLQNRWVQGFKLLK